MDHQLITAVAGLAALDTFSLVGKGTEMAHFIRNVTEFWTLLFQKLIFNNWNLYVMAYIKIKSMEMFGCLRRPPWCLGAQGCCFLFLTLASALTLNEKVY